MGRDRAVCSFGSEGDMGAEEGLVRGEMPCVKLISWSVVERSDESSRTDDVKLWEGRSWESAEFREEVFGPEDSPLGEERASSLSTRMVILLGSSGLEVMYLGFSPAGGVLGAWDFDAVDSVFPEYGTKIRTVSGVSVALGVAGSDCRASPSCKVVWLTDKQDGLGVDGLCGGLPAKPLCTTSPSLWIDLASLWTSPLVCVGSDWDGEWLLECLNFSVGDLGERTDCTDRVSGEMRERPDWMEAASMSPRLARVTEERVERSAAEVRDVLAREARDPPTPPRLLTSSMLHSSEYRDPVAAASIWSEQFLFGHALKLHHIQ